MNLRYYYTAFQIHSPQQQNKVLYQPLAEIDPEVKNIIDKETWRQFTGLELIASEVGICFLLFSLSPM